MAKTSSGGSGSGNAGPQGGASANDSRSASAREPGSTTEANSVRPSAPPVREARTDDAPRTRRRPAQSARERAAHANEPRPRTGAAAQSAAENAIRPTPRPVRDVSQEAAASEARTDATARPKARTPSTPSDGNEPDKKVDRHSVPEEVKRRFVRVGNKYHFPDGAQAFTDHGNRLTSASENTEVIKSLISIAQARGWSDITITGTERFRKEAWFAGRLAGLDVRGYAPTEFEQERLVRALARAQEPPSSREVTASPSKSSGDAKSGGNQRAEPRASEGRNDLQTEPRERHRTLQVGRLVDHGAAPYQHDPHNAMSYFVKLETDAGERVIWGVDLHRALKESLTRPQIGDEIGLRTIRRETVKVWEPQHDAEGRMIGEKKLEKHRNAWVVEKRDFFRERAQASRVLRDANVDQQQAVSRHPELIGTYLQLHAAELAAKNIRDPQDQKQFVASVRTALADSVARGEPLTPVRLKETTTPRREGRTPSVPASPERDASVRGVAPREQAPVRG